MRDLPCTPQHNAWAVHAIGELRAGSGLGKCVVNDCKNHPEDQQGERQKPNEPSWALHVALLLLILTPPSVLLEKLDHLKITRERGGI